MEVISLSHPSFLLLTHPDPNTLAQQKQNAGEVKITLSIAWVILPFCPTGVPVGVSVKDRHRPAVPSVVSLCSYGFWECEHLAPSSVFLIFIDFNYRTTWPRNPSQRFLLVLSLRNQIRCWRITAVLDLNGKWLVSLHGEILLGDFSRRILTPFNFLSHADVRC